MQILLLTGIGGVLLVRAKQTVNSAAVSFLAGGLLCFSLGNLFYVLHYMLKGELARAFSASDIAWLGAFFFFIGAHQLLNWKKRKASWKSWLLVGILIATLVYVSVQYGGTIVNAIWGFPLCTLAWFCGKGLDAVKREEGKSRLRPYYICLTFLLLCECGLFLTWGIGYVLMDAVLTVLLSVMGILFYRENLG